MKNPKLVDRSELKELGRKLRKENKRVIFTGGCFDLIHVGHARYLAKAKSLGDVLVVGLGSNQAVRQVKGKTRPIIDEKVRAEMLSFLEPVDYVHIHKEKTAAEAIRALGPDVLMMVKERSPDENVDVNAAKLNGAKIVVVPRQAPFLSTSAIIERVVGAEVRILFRKHLANKKDILTD